MSRDKQIEEMAKVIQPFIDDRWEKDMFPNGEEIAELLYNAGYRKTSEVAREVFEEIEKQIDVTLSIIQKSLHAKGGRANGKTLLIGKNQMLLELKCFIAELKKKYTEGEG